MTIQEVPTCLPDDFRFICTGCKRVKCLQEQVNEIRHCENEESRNGENEESRGNESKESRGGENKESRSNVRE